MGYQRIQHLFGFCPFVRFEVVTLYSPAELAHVVALVYRRRHLKASVTLDAVKILFVAIPFVYQALPHPMAQFHRSVIVMEAVLLFYQKFPVPFVHGIT
jgi:hypothetical protein